MIRLRIGRASWVNAAGQAWHLLRSPSGRRLVGALALLGYVLVSLWPFDWHPPERVDNGARVDPDTGFSFPTAGLARTTAPPAWLEAAARSGRLDLTLRVRPLRTRQHGPARIVSLAENGFARNLLIGQQGDDLLVDLRVEDAAGDDEHVARLRDVFVADRWIDLAVSIEPGALSVRAGDQGPVRHALAPDPLRTWDDTHRLAFGNEVTGNQPWLGEIGQVVVRTAGSVHAYPGAAPLEQPPTFWILSREPKSQPLRHLQAEDTVNNLLLYLPLGLFLALSPRAGGRHGALRALLLVAGLSATMELAQFFISTRNPSINDLILNVAGGAVGYALGRYAAPRIERILRTDVTPAATGSR